MPALHEGAVPGQSESAKILFTRINSIIELIPADFPNKGVLEKSLKGRQESIFYTAPEAMSIRWNEVAGILSDYLPDPGTQEWAKKIADLFSAEPV